LNARLAGGGPKGPEAREASGPWAGSARRSPRREAASLDLGRGRGVFGPATARCVLAASSPDADRLADRRENTGEFCEGPRSAAPPLAAIRPEAPRHLATGGKPWEGGELLGKTFAMEAR
jgi:hypothetical protein